MPLDMSRRRKGRLGRGPVPDDVKRRLDGTSQEPPPDLGFQETAEDVQRNLGGVEGLQERLREQGGRWENPRVWKPPDPARRKQIDEHRGKA